MKYNFVLVCLLVIFLHHFKTVGQEMGTSPHLKFWEKLESHCGKAYAGQILTAPVPKDFQQQKLVMHVKSCGEGQVRIPFAVGANLSRTWVFTLNDESITLKHDHRRKDGTPDEVSMYGGTSTNMGFDSLQYFPADQETVDMIPYASTNVWWVSITDSTFTYNLRRVNSDNPIRVEFDLTQEVQAPPAPWGWPSE